MSNKLQIILATIIGLFLLVLAFVYFLTPAGSLPTYLPGYLEASAKIHIKHGVGSLFLSLASFAFVWFKSGKI